MIVYDVATKVLVTELFPHHNITGLNSGITFIALFSQEKPLRWTEINTYTHTHTHISPNNTKNTNHRHIILTGIDQCNSKFSKNILEGLRVSSTNHHSENSSPKGVNLFHTAVSFYTPWKYKKQKFSESLRGYRKRLMHEIGWCRGSRLQMFFKIGVLKNFAKFTGKHLCWSLFFDKVIILLNNFIL